MPRPPFPTRAGRARRRVLHPGRVEGRAPASVVVLDAPTGPNGHHGAAVLRHIGRFGDWLYSLTGESAGETRDIDVALAALRHRLGGDMRMVAATLVEVHGPRIRLALHPFRDGLEVRALFEPRRGAPVVSRDEALKLVKQVGPRASAVALARHQGLGVFDRLNAHASDPGVRELLDLVPHRRRGRLIGHTTHNVEAYAIAEVIDLGISRAGLLSALGRNPKSAKGQWPDRSETADWKWLGRRLERGRSLRARVRAEPSPIAPAHPPADVAIVAFLDRNCRGMQPDARLGALAPYLVNALRDRRALYGEGLAVRLAHLLPRQG